MTARVDVRLERLAGRPLTAASWTRGQQSDEWLKLSEDAKTGVGQWWDERWGRWAGRIPNAFGLPAGVSCPGRTEFCTSCYAEASERRGGTHALVAHNFRLLRSTDQPGQVRLLTEMLARFVAACDHHGVPAASRMFRLHWDGDFYSVAYAEAWRETLALFPDVRVWAYTRSFTAEVNVVPVLAGLDNLTLYLSVDRHNTRAALEAACDHDGVMLAWCAVTPKAAAELVERWIEPGSTGPLRCPENAQRIPLVTDGVGACQSCRVCPDGKRDVVFAATRRRNR